MSGLDQICPTLFVTNRLVSLAQQFDLYALDDG